MISMRALARAAVRRSSQATRRSAMGAHSISSGRVAVRSAGFARGFRVSAPAAAETPFHLADIGEGIAEVELLQWYVKAGDTVEMFDKICEVQSDKATVDISSKYDGKITALHYEVGDMAIVGEPLITIDAEGEVEDEEAPQAAAASATADASASSTIDENVYLCSAGKALATPAVRRVAREYNIDIATIAGSGKDGRVLKEDVLRMSGAISPAAPTAATPQAKAAPAADSPPPSSWSPSGTAQDETIPLRGFNRIMAKTMTDALSIPHFLLCDEVEADAMIALRQELKPIAEARGIKFTYMPLMFKAASLAMQRFPHVNATIANDLSSITLKGSHNIGFACATDDGLVVPVVKDCQDKSVFEIAEDINRLIALARENKLAAEDVTGGTFSLSNIGSIGGIYGGPIITPPQVAIGAVGKLRTLPRYRADGTIYPASIFNVSWSGDHRVLDGATMTHFSNAWIGYLQKPHLMMCDMR